MLYTQWECCKHTLIISWLWENSLFYEAHFLTILLVTSKQSKWTLTLARLCWIIYLYMLCCVVYKLTRTNFSESPMEAGNCAHACPSLAPAMYCICLVITLTSVSCCRTDRHMHLLINHSRVYTSSYWACSDWSTQQLHAAHWARSEIFSNRDHAAHWACSEYTTV